MVLSELFILIIFFSCFLFFRRQGLRLITFDRQGGPFMVKGRSVSFSVCVCGFFGREGGNTP